MLLKQSSFHSSVKAFLSLMISFNIIEAIQSLLYIIFIIQQQFLQFMMRKEDDEKSQKRQAFMSFLQPSTNQSQLTQKKNNSDHEDVFQQEYIETGNYCGVCGKSLDQAKIKKVCGFCLLPTCPDHLRKKRRKKNKWEKICENCEDKYLYDSYMKLEIKAEEALGVQQQIVTMKHTNILELLEAKQVKRREVIFKTQQINNEYEEKSKKLTYAENKLQSISNKVQSDELTCRQIEQYINRIEKDIKENYKEDYNILTQEDMKLGKELTRIQKRCQQIKVTIEKRQKQFQEAYQEWEKKQYKKSMTDQLNSKANIPKGKCSIF